MSVGIRVEIDGAAYKVVEKPTHVAIYKTYVKRGFGREVQIWNSRRFREPQIGSTLARVLAAARPNR